MLIAPIVTELRAGPTRLAPGADDVFYHRASLLNKIFAEHRGRLKFGGRFDPVASETLEHLLKFRDVLRRARQNWRQIQFVNPGIAILLENVGLGGGRRGHRDFEIFW